MTDYNIFECVQSAHDAGYATYAVIEPGVWRDVDSYIESSSSTSMILAKGQLTPHHYDVLPRVVLLHPKNGFIQMLAKQMPDTGVLICTRQSTHLSDIISHLWDICQARLPDEKHIWFRFYEPYVVSTWFKQAVDSDINAFFGDIIFTIYSPDYSANTFQIFHKSDVDKLSAGKLPLTIYYDQIEKIDEALFNLFIHQLTRYLAQKYYPDMPDSDLPSFKNQIGLIASRAQHFNLATNDRIRRFAELAVTHGWTFSEHPAALNILENPELPPEAKISELERIMSERRPSYV